MEINKVTFTGADDNTNYGDLLEIQEKYPLVEWGILFSGSRKGTEKYPTQDWIDNLPKELNLSGHFCGKYSKNVIEEFDFEELEKIQNKFKRIQLNYTFKKGIASDLMPLFHGLYYLPFQFIFQYNKSNSATLDRLMENKRLNVSFLYDSSGGRGIEAEEYNKPFDYYTGYSGGISPDNIFTIKKKLKNIPFNNEIWIDMEGKIRTEGKFDLKKVEQVLKVVYEYN